MLLLLAAAALAGCASQDGVIEHPVAHALPALKPGVYSVGAVDVRPVAIHQVQPEDPYELYSIPTGTATVAFTVRADGKVADPLVVKADDVLFGESAVVAIRKWRFHPAQVHGASVDCRMSLSFAFASPYGNLYESIGGADAPAGPPPSDSEKLSIVPH